MKTLHHSPKPVILVVDDEALLRFLAMDILETAGFAVIEADNAESALALLRSRPDIAVLFTDVQMPGAFDGLELARRSRIERPDVHVMVTSGSLRAGSVELPADGDFLPKPYLDREVVKCARSHMKGQTATRVAA